jgi:hypothetical protein
METHKWDKRRMKDVKPETRGAGVIENGKERGGFLLKITERFVIRSCEIVLRRLQRKKCWE